MSVNPAVAHYFRKFRGNMERPAVEAFYSARAHIHFVKRLSATLRQAKARSKAAKRGWKTRRRAS